MPPARSTSASRHAAVRDLIDTTRAAMMAGIAAAVPGNHIDDISAAVEDVATPHGLGIIRQFVGHGIGTEMHEEPQVPNYRTGRKGRKIEPGLCLAIEPMFTLGGYEAPSSTTTGRSSPWTARSPPISSTRSPSPTLTVRRILDDAPRSDATAVEAG